jgi:hypothetical protein
MQLKPSHSGATFHKSRARLTVEKGRAKLVHELRAGSEEQGKREQGSKDCHQNFQNKGFSLKIEFFMIEFFFFKNFSENLDLLPFVQGSLQPSELEETTKKFTF